MNKFRSAILSGKGIAPPTPVVADKQARGSESDSLHSVDIPRDTSRSADHRDEDRHRLLRETATIGFEGRTLTADLINLSGGGAMIEADIEPRLWDRVDLFLGAGSPIECAVRWLRGGRIGLEFAHETRIECDAAERDALLLDVIRRSFPDIVATVPMVEPAPAPDEEVNSDTTTPPVDASRRRDTRHPLIWRGTILWQHETHLVRLRNISSSGVLIDAERSFPEGAELMLDLGHSGQYFAVVGWSRGGQAGLVFNAPFDLALLAAAKPDVAPTRWERPSYLNITESSPWATEWDRRGLADLRDDLEGFLRH
jgi:PilZ domain